jgi:hypothetical protein
MKKEYDFSKGKRGALVKVPKGKIRITIRLDSDVLDWFRSQVEAVGGGNYQTMINNALREYIGYQDSILLDNIRNVVREEILKYGLQRSDEPRNHNIDASKVNPKKKKAAKKK